MRIGVFTYDTAGTRVTQQAAIFQLGNTATDHPRFANKGNKQGHHENLDGSGDMST